MANKKHLEILERGVDVWNEWRVFNIEVRPDLRGADFFRADLRGADLSRVLFAETNFVHANLCDSNLFKADLSSADLRDANLGRADLASVNFRGANLGRTDLRNANLNYALLIETNLIHARLNGAVLHHANLAGADLSDADLSGADLSHVDFRGANLGHANLRGAIFSDVDFDNAWIGSTQFADVDLGSVKNLSKCNHLLPSYLDHSTLVKSGRLSEKFLRGCGLPDAYIEYIPALFWEKSPFEFYSCFISYSSKDEAFARRLHADLQDNGVRCWFAPEDLKIGDKIRSVIDDSIRIYDKLLLIFSENSLNSSWVENEVESAFEKEEKTKGTVLFPIRLDAAVMDTGAAWARTIKRSRHIGDFTRWKAHDAYRQAFQRLLRDLKER